MQQLVFGAGLLLLFIVAVSVAAVLSRREREKLRRILIENLEQLLESLERYQDLDDILRLLDVAELQVRHIRHAGAASIDVEDKKEQIARLRGQAIYAKVEERVAIQVTEARRAESPGSILRYATAAEAQVLRWIGHPSLTPAQRQAFQDRLTEIETILREEPTCAELRQATRHERDGNLDSALACYRHALRALESLEEIHTDEEDLIDDIQRRLDSLRVRMDGAGTAAERPRAAGAPAPPTAVR